MKHWYLNPLLWVLAVTRNLDDKRYHCSYHEELVFKPDCGNHNCWDAQLLDFHRTVSCDVFNKYRADVAIGQCEGCNHSVYYGNMFALNWHWRLEYEAQKLMKMHKCPFSIFNRNYVLPPDPKADDTKLYGDVFSNSIRYEYAATSFPNSDLGAGNWDQFEIYERNMSLNCFDEWDAKKIFRRAAMNYVGCAAVSRNHVTGKTGVGIQVQNARVTHILCVFASPVTDYTGIPGSVLSQPARCQQLTGLPQVTKYINPYLCAYENLKNPFIELPCQIFVYVDAPAGAQYTPFAAPCDEELTPLWANYINPHTLKDPIQLLTITYKNGTSITTDVFVITSTAGTSTTTTEKITPKTIQTTKKPETPPTLPPKPKIPPTPPPMFFVAAKPIKP